MVVAAGTAFAYLQNMRGRSIATVNVEKRPEL